MMRSYVFVAEAFAQMSRRALSHAPRVHEDERSLVLPNELRDAIVNLFPNFIRHQSFERRIRDFNCEIESAHVPTVDNCAARLAVGVDVRGADKKARDFLDWFLGCG